MLFTALASRFVQALHRRHMVTWERVDADAELLVITNIWPHPERPSSSPFVQYSVEGLRAGGLRCDVLLIRGYRGLHVYLLACVAMVMLPKLSRGKYRLIHSHGGETALVARFFWGAPVLASYLGTDILGPQEGSRRIRIKCLVRSWILRCHAPCLTATTTKSREMAALLPRRAQRRNWVIPDGVDRRKFRPIGRDDARRHIGWSADDVVVISVGNRVPLKRLWLADEATKLAAREVHGLQWKVISDVLPSEMPFLYNGADCLIHTSASEGSPNAIKEALACNLPVVATQAGDISELLNGVKPSAVCPPQSSRLAFELVECIRARQRSNGRDLTRHLDMEAISKRVCDCYAALGVDFRRARYR